MKFIINIKCPKCESGTIRLINPNLTERRALFECYDCKHRWTSIKIKDIKSIQYKRISW